jgi:hypothetical protein
LIERFDLATACEKINKGQRPLLEQLRRLKGFETNKSAPAVLAEKCIWRGNRAADDHG